MPPRRRGRGRRSEAAGPQASLSPIVERSVEVADEAFDPLGDPSEADRWIDRHKQIYR